MKPFVIAAVSALALAFAAPAASARPHHHRVAHPVASCGYGGPNMLGLAHIADLHRVAGVSTSLMKFTRVITRHIPGHFKWVRVGHHFHRVFVPPHTITKTKTGTKTVENESHKWKFDWGEYVGTSIAAAATSEIIDGAMTPCRQLTLSEAYANFWDGFFPIVGGLVSKAVMPDTPETIRIATLAKEGKITNDQALQMYAKAYSRH